VRKIALDFDLTVLLPLALFALIALWNSIRAYREFPPHRKEKWNAQRLVWLSSGVMVAICVLLFAPDDWKSVVAYLTWDALWFSSGVLFLISVAAAWHYAKRFEWFKLGICVLVGLIIMAGAEHFFHQKINANRINCPHCSDDDESGNN
jgi:hypothetical protein